MESVSELFLSSDISLQLGVARSFLNKSHATLVCW